MRKKIVETGDVDVMISIRSNPKPDGLQRVFPNAVGACEQNKSYRSVMDAMEQHVVI